MESLKRLVLGNKSTDENMAVEWIYEFNHGTDDGKGPFTLSKLNIESDKFTGEGREEGKYGFSFLGTIDKKSNKFYITQTFKASEQFERNKFIKGEIKQDGTLFGKWKHVEDHDENDIDSDQDFVGSFVIRVSTIIDQLLFYRNTKTLRMH